MVFDNFLENTHVSVPNLLLNPNWLQVVINKSDIRLSRIFSTTSDITLVVQWVYNCHYNWFCDISRMASMASFVDAKRAARVSHLADAQ